MMVKCIDSGLGLPAFESWLSCLLAGDFGKVSSVLCASVSQWYLLQGLL